MILVFINMFVILIFTGASLADNKGVFGAVFDIAEHDLVLLIEEKLKKMEESGELKTIQLKIRDKIVENIREPEEIEGIKHTTKARTFEFDPTIELTQDLKDHNGKIFAKKGDKYNPLDYISFSKPLIFIDGNNEEQIAWAKLKLMHYKTGKITLVAGSPLNLQEKLKRDVYFDQYGKITKKLGIKQVPAIIFQKEGKKVLTIQEELLLQADNLEGEK